jgi:HAMP domain-containing protein
MNDRRDSAWKRLSLSTRLNLITASILLGTMGAFVSMDYARERDALLRAHAEELATIAALTARTLPDRLSEITTEELRAIASTQPELRVAIHVVRGGKVVLSTGERATEFPALRRLDWTSDYDAWRTPTGLAVSIPYRSSPTGPTGPTGATAELFVETSLSSVNRTLSRTLRLHVIHGLATALAMMVGVAWVLRRAVHGPFTRMASAMNVMERGTWELDVPLWYDDEVGALTTAFNRMGRKLTRTARDFARAEKLSALAVLTTRLHRDLDSPLREIEAAASRLTARELSMADLEAAALRIHEAAAFSRGVVEKLDDVFLAELKVPTKSEHGGSTERASSDDLLAVE